MINWADGARGGDPFDYRVTDRTTVAWAEAVETHYRAIGPGRITIPGEPGRARPS